MQLQNILRQILEKLVMGLAIVFGVIALGLAAIPGLLCVALIPLAEDLSAEWRRGRDQTWLSRWARRVKVVMNENGGDYETTNVEDLCQ